MVAAAGWGKTTLLRSWHATETDASAHVSFDREHRSSALDAGVVLVSAAEQLGIGDDRLRTTVSLIPADGASLGSAFIGAFADLLQDMGTPFVVFLDDLHTLGAATTADVGQLVRTVADRHHRFVISSRRNPSWAVHRWRVNGFADILTADDLRLDEPEIAALLGTDHAALAPRVASITAGWPAAVQAVLWRVRLAPDADLEHAMLDLVDYVESEIFPGLGRADLDVLCRTSILGTFPLDVATRVTGDPQTPRILRETMRSTALLTILPDGRVAFDDALRTALRHRLATVVDDHGLKLLQKKAAAAWLDQPDSFDGLATAMDHLLDGHCWVRARELLRRRWPEVDRHSRLDAVVGWFEAIPSRWWRDDLDLTLLYGWANLRVGHDERALELLHDPVVLAHPAGGAIATVGYAWSVGWSTDPREAVTIIDDALGTSAGVGQDVQHYLAVLGVADYRLAGEVASAQANAIAGRWSTAAGHLERVLTPTVALAPATRISALGADAWVKSMQGDIGAARRQASESTRLAASCDMSAHIRTVPARIAMAVTAALGGDPDTAMAYVDDAAQCARRVRAANLLRIADLVASMCGVVDGSYLDGADPPLSPAPLPLVDQFLAAARARRLAVLGDISGAAAELSASAPHEFTLSHWAEVLLDVRGRRATSKWLSAQPPATCNHGRVVRLLAEAASAAGDPAAQTFAAQAAEVAAAERLLGVLATAPHQLWRRHGVRSAHPLLAEAINTAPTYRSRVRIPALTRRELDLLRMLVQGRRIGDIADALYLSVNTVKWHRANLYRKLGVPDRAAAVHLAAEMRLFDLSQPR